MDRIKYLASLANQLAVPEGASTRSGRGVAMAPAALPALSEPSYVDGNALISFASNLSDQDREDVLFSVQLAQRAATFEAGDVGNTESWYRKFVEVLSNLGWIMQQSAFVKLNEEEGDFQVDAAALNVIMELASQNQIGALKQAVSALKNAANDGAIKMFAMHSRGQQVGNFQLGAAERQGGVLAMCMGAFRFETFDLTSRFIFLSGGSKGLRFWTGVSSLSLNDQIYALVREQVKAMILDQAPRYLATVKLSH